MNTFLAVRIEGGLLGPDTLEQLLAGELPGQKPKDFGLDGRRSFTDEIASVFADARAEWEVFQRRLERLPDSDLGTSVTRDTWMIPFLSLLGYELRYNPRAYEVDGASYAISHRAGEPDDAPPAHIVGARQELGRVAPTGRPRLAPHSLVQEFLNRSEQLWGIVTNGLTLRLLRDSTYVRRQAYVEFDLQQILEEQRFLDFSVLFRLLHRSRLPRSVADARDCLLERYYQHGLEQGGRVRERLRDGVEECLKRLANGFLAHPANSELRRQLASGEQRVASGTSAEEDFYRQLLRLIYRFLFLLVSEDRGLVSSNPLYTEHYGVSRLRRLLDRRSAYTDHDDLWCSLRVLWKVFSDERLASFLGAAPLNGDLFEPLALDHCTITNRDLLEAFWYLAYYRETPAAPPRLVNYAALDVEELGSVYESLLDYHPVITASSEWRAASGVRFDLVSGSERKSTGSYYTPPELVAELVRSALEPVLAARLAAAERAASSEWRVANEWIVKEYGRTHASEIVSRLASLAESYGLGRGGIPPDGVLPTAGAVRAYQPNAPGSHFDPGKHRRGMGTPGHEGVSSVPQHRSRQSARAGDAHAVGPAGLPGFDRATRPSVGADSSAQPPVAHPATEPSAEIASLWSVLPLATRYSLLTQAFAEQALLSLRVLDPACGSGHFLLAAARRLGKELARVRTGEDEPAPERVREAIRDVVAHCIYGVDKNPLAVELCRVALWLEAHCEGKPLTFVDHRIRCGDSLVGVVDLAVLEQGIPDEAYEAGSVDDRRVARSLKRKNKSEREGQYVFDFDARAEVGRAAASIRPLLQIPDDAPAQIRKKAQALHDWERQTERDRTGCHLWTSAFFQPLVSHNPPPITTDTLRQYLESGAGHGQVLGSALALAHEHRYFHWPLEFPEVFDTGGFDVVIGNPPFMGGLKISGTLGDKYRHWLEATYAPYAGTADLCAALYRRAFSLLKRGGRLGMVATNTIGQGDTRESGLAVILQEGGTITFARRFIKWPGAANVEVNLVALHKPDHSPFAIPHSPFLDGTPVPFISSRLDDQPEAEPKRLRQNEGKAFIGDYVRGIGFVLEPEEAEALLAKDPRNADCLFPYLNGEDLNSDPEQKPRRYVICFHGWGLEQAKQYPNLLKIVEERVRPERERLRNRDDRRDREHWWLFARYRGDMRPAIAPLQRVLVACIVTEYWAPTFAPNAYVFAHRVVVFAFSDDYHYALLQSSLHELWARQFSSTLESRLNYSPTDCFDTFPFPPKSIGEWRVDALPEPFQRAAEIGAEYHEHRRQIMLRRQIGLTRTYNLFHDPNCHEADIQRLRELHVEMDRAVLACYGWGDITLEHGFYPNERGQRRYTPSLGSRREILARLLRLNLELAASATGGKP